MAPTTLLYYSPRVAAMKVSSAIKTVSPVPAFTPLTIVALVLIMLLSVILFGALAIFVYRQFFRSSPPNQVQDPCNVKPEAQAKAQGLCAPDNLDSRQNSLWAPSVSWLHRSRPRPPEPELPWPVLAVLPSLRPVPLHRRVLKSLAFWKKEDVKHEPFTVADVLHAIDDLNARQQGQEPDSLPASTARAERATVAHPSQDRGWNWLSWRSKSANARSLTVPEIVIYPCDSSPAFTYDADAPALAQPCIINGHHAPLSAPPTPSAGFSPTISEPDSSAPSTPDPHSRPPVVYVESLEVPMPSTIAPREQEEQDRVVATTVNVSNFSGEPFALAAPPAKAWLKEGRQDVSASWYEADRRPFRRVGIGLGFGDMSLDLDSNFDRKPPQRRSSVSASHLDSDFGYARVSRQRADLPLYPQQNLDTLRSVGPSLADNPKGVFSSYSSEASVVDLVAVLAGLTSTATMPSMSTVPLALAKQCLVSASTSDESTVLQSSGRRYARLIDAFNTSYPRLSLEFPGPNFGSDLGISSFVSSSSSGFSAGNRSGSPWSGILEDYMIDDARGEDDNCSVVSRYADYYKHRSFEPALDLCLEKEEFHEIILDTVGCAI